MNTQIEIIERALKEIQTALNELRPEAPYLTFGLDIDVRKLRPSDIAEKLQCQLNQNRLRNAAIAKYPWQ